MARFRFRLERLLALRRAHEDLARLAASSAAAGAEMRRAGRDQALEVLCRAGTALASHPAAVDAARLALESLYLARTRRQAVVAQGLLVEAERIHHEKIAAAVAAWRSRETLNHLKSRQEAAWSGLQASAEQRELDDISAASRWRSA